MSTEISLTDGTLILNGAIITGFGDAENAIEFPNHDIMNVRRGADGRMVAGKTGNVGGPLNLQLLPNGFGFAFLMGIRSLQNNGGHVLFQGVYTNLQAGFRVGLLNDVLTNAPSGTTVGNAAPPSHNFTLEFERIEPDYSLMVLAP